MVIIKDDDVRSRCAWRLGRVESLVVGGDDQVRGANLRTISKKFRGSLMTRPLQKIIPLEVTDSSMDMIEPQRNTSSGSLPPVDSPSDEPPSRTRRVCATEGEARRRANNQI